MGEQKTNQPKGGSLKGLIYLQICEKIIEMCELFLLVKYRNTDNR